jgi:type VI protein secretion system component VasF
MEAALQDLSTKIAAHGKMIEFFHELIDLGYEGSDKYLESRVHELNCVYAQLQVERLDLLANPRDTIS